MLFERYLSVVPQLAKNRGNGVRVADNQNAVALVLVSYSFHQRSLLSGWMYLNFDALCRSRGPCRLLGPVELAGVTGGQVGRPQQIRKPLGSVLAVFRELWIGGSRLFLCVAD